MEILELKSITFKSKNTLGVFDGRFKTVEDKIGELEDDGSIANIQSEALREFDKNKKKRMQILKGCQKHMGLS